VAMLLEVLKNNFRYIVAFDYEFRQPEGDNPIVVCGVYKELKSNKTYKQKELPYPIEDTLFVSFASNAEASCLLSLGYGLPKYVWDPYIINKKLFNGKLKIESGAFSLINTANRYGIKDVISTEKKEYFRDLILNNKTYTPEQFNEILDYCESDVITTEKLFYEQLKHLDQFNSDPQEIISQTLFHSKAFAYTALIERNGIPVDANLYNDFNKYFVEITHELIKETNSKYDLYEDNSFSHKKFEKFIESLKINNWPLTKTGKLKTDRDTIKEFSKIYNEVADFQLTQEFVSCRNLKGYLIGKDGRSRTSLHMFQQKTGRTNASPAKYPFGAPKWSRNFIRPDEGKVLLYLDYKSQEPAIQAALSGDENLLAAYNSGDIYLYTAKLAGAAPQEATKKSHPKIRELYKVAFLANGYGQEAYGLSKRLNIPLSTAKKIRVDILNVYQKYFKWINAVVSKAMQRGYIKTVFGWTYHLSHNELSNPRSLLNWPIQSHGSEILRKAIIDLIDSGYEVSAIVHDAVLIHVPKSNLKEQIVKAQEILSNAAYEVIGFKIPTDVRIIRRNFEQEGDEQDKFIRVIEKYNRFKRSVAA
jgi:DNA polymerase I-like protein with 3'-5' exonuclease and polymerase domains